MALSRLNYKPGDFDAITDEALDDTPVLNTWYHFRIDDWPHLISDITLKQSAVAIPGTAYELTEDTKYTGFEENESGKTLYGLWRIVDNTYAGIATTVSGNNFGSYVDNETVEDKVSNTLKKTGDDLEADTITFTEWTDKGSGTSTGHTYDLDDSNLQKYNKTGGTATYLFTLSNGGDGTYILKLANPTGGSFTVTFSGGTIKYPDGETDFTQTNGTNGLYTVVKDGTTHYVTLTEMEI